MISHQTANGGIDGVVLKGLMFPCTLSILKPIHTDYFPKQTRAFQADKGISGRKETDWKRLTVRFASKKQKKTYFTFYS